MTPKKEALEAFVGCVEELAAANAELRDAQSRLRDAEHRHASWYDASLNAVHDYFAACGVADFDWDGARRAIDAALEKIDAALEKGEAKHEEGGE